MQFDEDIRDADDAGLERSSRTKANTDRRKRAPEVTRDGEPVRAPADPNRPFAVGYAHRADRERDPASRGRTRASAGDPPALHPSVRRCSRHQQVHGHTGLRSPCGIRVHSVQTGCRLLRWKAGPMGRAERTRWRAGHGQRHLVVLAPSDQLPSPEASAGLRLAPTEMAGELRTGAGHAQDFPAGNPMLHGWLRRSARVHPIAGDSETPAGRYRD